MVILNLQIYIYLTLRLWSGWVQGSDSLAHSSIGNRQRAKQPGYVAGFILLQSSLIKFVYLATLSPKMTDQNVI